MFSELFFELLGLLGSIITGGLIIVAVGVVSVVTIIVVKSISLAIKTAHKKEVRREMEDND